MLSRLKPHRLFKQYSAAILILLLPAQAFALTFIVNAVSDNSDQAPKDGLCLTVSATCTLRAAIDEANAWPGRDIIQIPAGTYTLGKPGPGEDLNSTGDLDITDDLNILGAGSAQTIIDASSLDRALHIHPTVTVTLSGIQIRNGKATNAGGGGIRNEGSLSLFDTNLNNNISQVSNSFGGGAIHSIGNLSLDHVILENNKSLLPAIDPATFAPTSAVGHGGALFIQNGNINIHHSTLRNNVATISGGAIYNTDGNITITDTTIENNATTGLDSANFDITTLGAGTFGGVGGGIANFGALSITGSTISGNSTFIGKGGAIFHEGNPDKLLIISNSTIYDNIANGGYGGGIYDGKGNTIISQSSISFNESNTNNSGNSPFAGKGGGIFFSTGASTIVNDHFKNTLISDDNIADISNADCSSGQGNVFFSLENNIGSINCGLSAGTNDILTATTSTTLETTLSNNGGPTKTRALKAAGPAINTGNCSAVANDLAPPLLTDQRGVARPIGSCDIGAYEWTVSETTWSDIGIHTENITNPVATGAAISYAVTLVNNGPVAATNIAFTHTLPVGLTGTITNGNAPAGVTLPCPGNGTPAITCTIPSLAVGATASFIIDSSATLAAGSLSSTTQLSVTDLNISNDNETIITDVVTADPVVTAAVTVLPTAVIVGETATFTIALNNLVNTTNPQLFIELEAFTLANATSTFPDVQSILITTAGLTNACVNSVTEILCDLNGFSGSSIDIEIVFNSKPATTERVTATATLNHDGIETDVSNILSSATLGLTIRTDVSVSMADSPDPATSDADLQHILTLSNAGPSPATNPLLVVTLPIQTTFTGITSDLPLTVLPDGQALTTSRPNEWFCHTNTLITCTIATLRAGTTSSINIFSIPTAAAVSASPILTTASITVDLSQNDSDTNNNTTAENTVVNFPAGTVETNADLNVVVAATPTPALVNNNLAYAMTIQNNGNATANDVVLTTVLTGDYTLIGLSQGCAQTAPAEFTCILGQVYVTSTATARFVISPNTTGQIVNNSNVINRAGADSNISDNSDAITTSVIVSTGSSTNFTPKGSSACFIATAAYGSYLDPHVEALRQFRDNVMLESRIGTALVDFYYQNSPPIAAYISNHDVLRTMTRWALTPIVYGVQYPLLALSLLLIMGIGIKTLPKRLLSH